MENLLSNPGFEGNWWRKTFSGQEFGEIFVPEAWVAFWKEGGKVSHDPNNPIGYGRPEVHLINREPPYLDPPRVRGGSRAMKYFSFYRIHDAGLYQRVTGLTPGVRLRATGWAHAWSSSRDNARVSDGVGEQAFAAKVSQCARDDAVRNFVFRVGIDPRGGADPWSDAVVWGEGIHIYNAYAQMPAVEVTAYSSAVTVFIRSSVLWPFKHCDSYLDDMELLVVGQTPESGYSLTVTPGQPVAGGPFEVCLSGDDLGALSLGGLHKNLYCREPRLGDAGLIWSCVAIAPGDYLLRVVSGSSTAATHALKVLPAAADEEAPPGSVPPREPYARTYLLLPPGAGDEWLQAVVDSGLWSRRRWTIGASADDAGVGPQARRIVVVNSGAWPGDLPAFFAQYYPGAEIVFVEATAPEELVGLLSAM